MKSDFPLITRITESRAYDDEHLSIRLDVWTDDGQRFVRLSRIAARQLFEQLETFLHPAKAEVEAKVEAGDDTGTKATAEPFGFKM